jgi:hypothetical protein
MNIIEARARTEDGQKYRRIGEDWYVVKGQESAHGYLSSRSAVATDWYPDPPGPWMGIDLGEDAEINEADREFLAGNKWTAKQISDMVKNTKPGPMPSAQDIYKDWLQRNTKRIEDLEAGECRTKIKLDILAEGLANHTPNTFGTVDNHAREQFSMLRKRVQSLESFEKRIENWAEDMRATGDDNFDVIEAHLKELKAWQKARNCVPACEVNAKTPEKGKGK